jgi:hypothetical protein
MTPPWPATSPTTPGHRTPGDLPGWQCQVESRLGRVPASWDDNVVLSPVLESSGWGRARFTRQTPPVRNLSRPPAET